MTTEVPHGFELGPLETDVMRLVWEMGEAGVDEVHRILQANRPIAYTTVMTVMTRLAAKGLLDRRKAGRAFLYQAARPRDEIAKSTLEEWAQRYWGGQVLPAISLLLGNRKLSPEDVAALREMVDRLEREVEKP